MAGSFAQHGADWNPSVEILQLFLQPLDLGFVLGLGAWPRSSEKAGTHRRLGDHGQCERIDAALAGIIKNNNNNHNKTAASKTTSQVSHQKSYWHTKFPTPELRAAEMKRRMNARKKAAKK
jgi:hypothetical protein